MKRKTKCNRCGRVGHWARECRQKRSSPPAGSSTSSSSQPKPGVKESGAGYVAPEEQMPEAQPEFVASVGCQLTLVQRLQQQACNRSATEDQSTYDVSTEVFLVSSPGFAVLDSGCGKTIIGDRTLKQFQQL